MSWFNLGNKEKAAKTADTKSAKEMTATARDPVCRMDVAVNKAVASSQYQGKTYYFCAVGCKKTFDQNPARYLGGVSEKSGQAGHGGHGCCG